MNSKVIVRNSFWLMLDSVLGLLVALITSVAVARVIGPEKLGYFNYVIWLSSISGMIFTVGVTMMLRKYLAEFQGQRDIAKARAVLLLCFRLYTGISVFLLCSGLAIVAILVPANHRLYSALAVLSLLPSVLMSIPSAANAAVEDMAPNVWASLASTPVNFAGVVLSLVLDWGLVGLTGALLVSRMADFLVRYTLYRRRFPRELLVGFKEAFSLEATVELPAEVRFRMTRFFSQATVLSILDTVVWDRSEMFFLKRFCDIRQLAFYSLSFNNMQQPLLISRVFAQAAGVTMMAEQGRAPHAIAPMTATATRYVALLALPVSMGIVALSSPLMHLLYGEQYLPAIPVLALVAIFTIPTALILPVKQMLIVSDHQGFLLKWGCTTAVLNLLLDLWWIPRQGAIGAALANGVTQFVASLGIYAFAVRRLALPLPSQTLAKVLFSASAMASLVAGLTHWLPPALAVATGVPAGVAVFLCMLRWTRSFEPGDLHRLLSVRQQLPPWLRGVYVNAIQRVLL